MIKNVMPEKHVLIYWDIKGEKAFNYTCYCNYSTDSRDEMNTHIVNGNASVAEQADATDLKSVVQ